MARLDQGRKPALGLVSTHGERGITKRLGALGRLTDISGTRLLDVGCGDGRYTVRMATGFTQVDAVDVDAGHLDVFRATVGELADRIHITQMAAETLDFPPATFDVVTAIEVLEHVENLDTSLGQIHRVLAPGGRFLLTTPNKLFPLETHGFLIRGHRYRPLYGPGLPWIGPLHARLSDARSFTARDLSRRIDSHGFTLTGLSYIMPPLDRSRLGPWLRPVLDRVEDSPLRCFGMALVMAFHKR